jgi:nitrate reductase gamma subunit
MMHSTISHWFSGALDLALLGCGLYYMVFAQTLRERREVAAQASRTTKPPPDYFRLGLVLAICGTGLLYLNFLR